MEDNSFSSSKDIKKSQEGEVSFGLIDKGVPSGIAFALAHTLMFFRKGKPVRVKHYDAVKKQVGKKLNVKLWQRVHIQEIESPENSLEYLGLPKEPVLVSQMIYLIDNNFSYVAKIGRKSYLVRTNREGHKVTKVKDISGYFGFS